MPNGDAVRLMLSSGMQYAVLRSRGCIAAANPKFDGSPGVLKRQVVSPRSSLLKRAAGSVPAQTTFGVLECPGSMCQVLEKVRSAPSGKAGFFVVFHVLPMSRLTSMRDPPHVWLTAANMDPSRGSYAAWWISAGANSGPSHANEPRPASPRKM